ncbi:MAG: glycosyltransferase family 39 protein [Desulfuromonadales bacterium]|nr:glycosyltransferase family 39 protein [Desulfuromonadales bacterium]
MKYFYRTRLNLNVCLFGIILISFFLRIWGVDFGLPEILHTDEWFEVKRALKLGSGVVDFDRVTKGGYYYLLFVFFAVYYLIMKSFGVYSSGGDLLVGLFSDPTHIWLIGRTTTVFLGTLTCFFIYLIGKNIHSKSTGIISALFLSVNLIHVRSSHYITVDVPLAFLIVVSFYLMIRKPVDVAYVIKDYVLLAMVIAAAIMTKIPGAVIFLSFFWFHWRNVEDETSSVRTFKRFFDVRLLCFFVVFLLVYLIGNPGIIFKAKKIFLWFVSFFYSSDSASVVRGPEFPHFYSSESPIVFYLKSLFPYKYFFLNISIIFGIFVTLAKFKKYLIFNLFFLAYLFFLFSSKSVEHVYPRYLLPVVPLMGIYFGILCSNIYSSFKNKAGKHLTLFFISILLFFSLVPCVIDVINLNIDFSKPDTRLLAKEWVHENIPEKSSVFVEGNVYRSSPTTVPLFMSPELIFSNNQSMTLEDQKSIFYTSIKTAYLKKKTYKLIFTSDEYSIKNALEVGEGDYIILRSSILDNFKFPKNREQFPRFYQLVKLIDMGIYKKIAEFKPSSIVMGPELLIFRKISS